MPEAPHDRPAGVDEGPEQHHDHQVQRVVARSRAAARRSRTASSDEGDDAHVHRCWPRYRRRDRSPCGRQNIIDDEEQRRRSRSPTRGGSKKPPTEMNCAKMKAATKPPTMLPRPPSTQIMKVIGPNGQADRRVDVVLQHQQAGGEAGQAAADRRGDAGRRGSGSTPISGMIARSWLIARIAVPMIGARQEQPGHADRRERDAKAISRRAARSTCRRARQPGSCMPRLRNSMPKATRRRPPAGRTARRR